MNTVEMRIVYNDEKLNDDAMYFDGKFLKNLQRMINSNQVNKIKIGKVR